MNRIKNFEIVLDADDVLLDCNAYALDLLREARGGSCVKRPAEPTASRT